MKTIKQTESSLSKQAQDASLIYLKAIESLMTGTANLKVQFIKNGTMVFDSNGKKLGSIFRTEWTIATSNAYGMPLSFSFTYFVKDGKKNTHAQAYKPDQIFTKEEILKILEDKIKKLRKLK